MPERNTAGEPALTNTASLYAGAQFLLRAEDDLRNYNDWIVDTFIRALGADARAGDRLGAQTTVLDFGCGIGTLSRIFAQRTGTRPDGVELDASQRALFAERGFRGFASLGESPPRYDVIFTSNILEHIADDVAVLAELRQRLADHGTLLIYVPAFNLLWTRMDDKIGHHRRYTRGDLVSRLERTGYTVVQARYCDSVGFFLALAFRFVGSKDDEPSPASLRLFDRVLLPVSKLLDSVLSPLLGKNVFVVARKRNGP